MKDVMIDLETLGTKPGCVVISIGAVFFDYKTMELGAYMHAIINKQSSMELGLFTQQDTIEWWDRQSIEAREVLTIADGMGITVDEALNEFAKFLGHDARHVNVWGNGSDFDNVILAEVYDKAKVSVPWRFYNNCCYRTLKKLAPDIKMSRVGVHHNALDDARSQALHAMLILRSIRYDEKVFTGIR